MSAEPAPTPEQLDAQAQLAAIYADRSHPYNVGGADYPAAEAEVLGLRRIVDGPANQPLLTIREQGDPPVATPGPAPFDVERPPLTGGARFDDALVGQLTTALEAAGLTSHTTSMLLGVLAQEHNEGRLTRWSPEAGGAALADKHGAREAEALIDDAERAVALLPAALRQEALRLRALANPRLIGELADLWRRSRHARR